MFKVTDKMNTYLMTHTQAKEHFLQSWHMSLLQLVLKLP